MNKNNVNGFTLLELLAVLVVMAAQAVIAVPVFVSKGNEARLQAHKANIREINNAIQRYEWSGEAIATDTYYNILDDNNALVTSKYLHAEVSSPYDATSTLDVVGGGTDDASNFTYFIGKDANGRTEVRLIRLGSGEVPTRAGALTNDVFNAYGTTATTIHEILIDGTIKKSDGGVVGDTDPPSIVLANLGGNVTSEIVTATITDVSAISSKKWASGTQNVAYFATGGMDITDTTFGVVANGIYTVYAKDAAGNEAVQTIDIGNIVTIAEGQYIKFGSYLGQPIVWRIIHKVTAQDLINEPSSGLHEGDLYLLSDRIITMKPYDAKDPAAPSTDGQRAVYGSNYWGNSNIREWLNSTDATVAYSTQKPDTSHVWSSVNSYETEAGFLTNFTANEKNQIIQVTHKSIVDNNSDGHDGGTVEHGNVETGIDESVAAGTNYSTAYYKNTTDKIFLASLGELATYVDGVLNHPSTSTKYQIAYTTQQARTQSTYASDPANDTTAWYYWTRDAYTFNSSGVHGINGLLTLGHPEAFSGNFGVRPATFIKSLTLTLDNASGADAFNAYTITSFN